MYGRKNRRRPRPQSRGTPSDLVLAACLLGKPEADGEITGRVALVKEGDPIAVAIEYRAEASVHVGMAVQSNGVVALGAHSIGCQRWSGSRVAEHGRLEANTPGRATLADVLFASEVHALNLVLLQRTGVDRQARHRSEEIVVVLEASAAADIDGRLGWAIVHGAVVNGPRNARRVVAGHDANRQILNQARAEVVAPEGVHIAVVPVDPTEPGFRGTGATAALVSVGTFLFADAALHAFLFVVDRVFEGELRVALPLAVARPFYRAAGDDVAIAVDDLPVSARPAGLEAAGEHRVEHVDTRGEAATRRAIARASPISVALCVALALATAAGTTLGKLKLVRTVVTVDIGRVEATQRAREVCRVWHGHIDHRIPAALRAIGSSSAASRVSTAATTATTVTTAAVAAVPILLSGLVALRRALVAASKDHSHDGRWIVASCRDDL